MLPDFVEIGCRVRQSDFISRKIVTDDDALAVGRNVAAGQKSVRNRRNGKISDFLQRISFANVVITRKFINARRGLQFLGQNVNVARLRLNKQRFGIVRRVRIFDFDFLRVFGFRRFLFIGRFVGIGDGRFFDAVNYRFIADFDVIADVADIQKTFAADGFENSDVFPIAVFRVFDLKSSELFTFFIECVNKRAVARIVMRPENIRLAF